jgi:phosphatidylethanolamine/phosphatidyl-N-methylethanolamine N-methyltransferase
MPITNEALSSKTCLAPSDSVAPPNEHRLTQASVLTAYRRMAPIYDWVFDACFAHGRRQAIAALSRGEGRRVLEVGVGTGLSLRQWPRDFSVTGIDLSAEMLQRAEKARQRFQLTNVTLKVMDAQAMEFPDDSFDSVAAMYVVSVAPDLSALLREMRRVCRPGGAICIVNHFEHENRMLRWFEESLSGYAGVLGFDSALPISRITELDGFRVQSIRPVNWGGFWSLIVAENVK